MAYHLDKLTEEYAASGLPPAEARQAARAAFGSTARLREECREQRPTLAAENLLQDVRHGLRLMRRHPGHTAVVAVKLAADWPLCAGRFRSVREDEGVRNPRGARRQARGHRRFSGKAGMDSVRGGLGAWHDAGSACAPLAGCACGWDWTVCVSACRLRSRGDAGAHSAGAKGVARRCGDGVARGLDHFAKRLHPRRVKAISS